ncbi:MAG: hypothetical protein Q8L07_11505 [Sediminibacterium sp.]|nr:hypothetical protein [Sediminibacterium sp.]
MKQNEKLSSAFNRLEQRLYELENDETLDLEYEYVPKHSIYDLLTGEILTWDLEDAQNNIIYCITVVERVMELIPNIINRSTFSTKMIDWEKGEWITAEDFKLQVMDNLKGELNYYLSQLNQLLTTVLSKNEALGDDRFSNAGFKVMIDLNVEQLGSLFNLMYETELISNTNYDGSKLSKKKLSEFISKNFTCTTEDISAISLEKNYLTRKNRIAEGIAEEKIRKLLELAQTDYIEIKKRKHD